MASMSKMRDPNTPRHTAGELPSRRPFQARLPAFSWCPHTNTARSLVVCIDGTANQFSAKSTNIIELFSRLVKDEEACCLTLITDLFFRNFEYIIDAAYKWLSENYKPGDRIYLFGFSRGAYQVRVIAGMIHKVGLLHEGHKNQIPFAYELYASVTDRTKREPEAKQAQSSEPGSSSSTNAQTHLPNGVYPHLLDADIEDEHKLCKQFKATLCRKDVKVHFVGAWDAVSSIGIFHGKSLPETVSGMGHVCVFRHALALDERRVKFQPEYANGGLGPEQGDRGDVKEVWFAGSHSDIGGGNVTNENLSNFGPALRWMTPHLGAPRLIKPRQLIHESVFTALNAAQPTGIVSKPSNKDSEAKSPTDEVLSIVASLKPTSARSAVSSLDLDDLSLLMPGAFSALVKIVPTPPISPARPYTPSTILPKVTKGRNYHWDELFSTFKTEPIVEKDSFDDMTPTLQNLEEFCAELEQRTRNSTLDDEELAAIRFHVFTATVLTLRSFVTDTTRLASLAEVPNLSKILLDALAVAYEHLRSDRDSRRTLLRLLTHARSIPLRGERKYKITQIQAYKMI
ncbi:hypothetical protein ONZ45_g13088 [Pleurotus djamor]|nr:hypothetical protein ONZ45_g13088 [Pleurotus djamor]